MTNTERLIEAVEYSAESDTEWFESFDSEREAMKILKAARREEIEDEQIVCFLSARDVEYDMTEHRSPKRAYDREILNMKRELRERIMSSV